MDNYCFGFFYHPANGSFKDHVHEKESLVEQQSIRRQFKSISSVWNFHLILPTNGKKTLCYVSCYLSLAVPG